MQRRAHRAIGRHAPRDDERRRSLGNRERARRAINEAIHHRLLEARGNVRVAPLPAVDSAHHRALEPGEGEMRLSAAHQRAGQRHGGGIALARQRLHHRPAGIAQAQDLGRLVEGLAQRVVDRGRQPAVSPDALDDQDLAMSARNQQQQIGIVQRRIGQARGQGVAFQVVDRDQRLAARQRQRLGGDQPHHHAANQARPGGGRDGVDIVQGEARIGQRPLDQRGKLFGMRARGDLRHHAAIGAVLVLLRGDALGENVAARIDDRSRRFVAARFDAKDPRHPGFHWT